ncbi:MAG: Signal recognition particle protein [Phycisphaerae bacterium]|nr:Signal recognition particle protein [Phycisphaerae bacterium]
MFEALQDKFSGVLRRLSGRGKISDANVAEAMAEVRTALLEADVNFQVVRRFCDQVMEKARGQEVIKSLHPGQLMIKIVHDQLVELMGPVDSKIHFVSPGPTVLMLAGLQGSGKTTTAAKLAVFCKKRGKRPALVAADLQRPAAIDQLQTLGDQIEAPVYRDDRTKNAVAVARDGVKFARDQGCDVVIVDTAGRLHVDAELMDEVGKIAAVVQPHQIYLVADAMTGQDAVNSAKAFNERLELDGVILTKFDSDARGGAALSVKAVTGKPIKFIGVGEKLEGLEEFHADRMAGRILGMGDVLTLVEKAQQELDAEKQAEMAEKLEKGRLTLDDFRDQLQQMRKMGPLKQMLSMIPGLGDQMKGLDIDDREMDQTEAIISSMTRQERERPEVIDGSRRRRIAAGSGTEPADVSQLLKGFEQMRRMTKMMAGQDMRGRMQMMQQMGKMDLLGAKMPKIKGGPKLGTSSAGKLSKKERRQHRKRRK